MATNGSFETINANYIGDIEVRSDGAFVVLDTKGEAPAEMGRTVVRIVTEELALRGVGRARLRPVRRSDSSE
jgi:hypothetical protein